MLRGGLVSRASEIEPGRRPVPFRLGRAAALSGDLQECQTFALP
jgi:hypothetical protein